MRLQLRPFLIAKPKNSPAWPNLLQRFVRLDDSRGAPGSGLGLSLVAAVAKLHGARLDLAGNKPGLSVTLTFPGR